jgi:hypothetical protein
MCQWKVEATPKAKQEKSEPKFNPKYDAHMKGEHRDDNSVSGLHTLHGKTDKEFQFANQRVPDATCGQIFAAKVRLCKYDKYEKAKASDEKLSSFWPTSMCHAHVKEAIIYAWRDWKKNNQVSSEHQFMSKRADEKIKWVGKVKIKEGESGKSYIIWVGSPETGNGESEILSAFPTINGKFL